MTPSALLRSAVLIALAPPVGSTLDQETASGESPDASRVIQLLAANKVSLLAVQAEIAGAGEHRATGLLAAAAFDAAIEAERIRRGRLLADYRPVADALLAAGIRPVLFKSPFAFPYLSSNLDVLVEPARFAEASRIIAELGHIRFPHYREDHKLLFRTFAGGRPALSVHLHEAVSWGKIVVIDGADVVARSVAGDEPGLFVAAPADGLAATIAHSILETDQIRLSDLRTARYCLSRGARVAGLLALAAERRWKGAAASSLRLYDAVSRKIGGGDLLSEEDSDLISRAIEESPWSRWALHRVLPGPTIDMPHRTPLWFSKGHMVRILLADDRREPDRKIADLVSSGWNLVVNRYALRCRPAQLITISGPDGAGKSRLAGAIEETLRLCEVPVTRFWSRGGFSKVAVSGKALARRLSAESVPAAGDEEGKRAFLATGWRRRLWTWTVVLEQAAALQRARWGLLLGRTIICDRYAYDSLADLFSRLPERDAEGPSRAAGFLLGAAPTPDLSFLIEVEADVAHARKEDGTSLASRRRLTRAYASIAGAAPFERLDGNGAFDEMSQAAIDVALRRTFSAFGGGEA